MRQFTCILLSVLGAFMLAYVVQAGTLKEKKMNSPATTNLKHAYFAAGCFWKVQYVFSQVPGVVSTSVGYTGGTTADPTYKQVCTDTTGHAEAVKVDYDPAKVTYRHLLEVFWTNHDPTTSNRQGPDIGSQYRSAIFYTSPEQQQEALQYKTELDKSKHFKSPIVTLIEPLGSFYEGEEYHQDYFKKHGAVCH